MNRVAPQNRIALLVPTRGRPAQLADMWLSALQTAEHPHQLQLILGLDEDDPARDAYLSWAHQEMGQTLAESRPQQLRYNLTPRLLLSEYWNALQKLTDAAVYWHGNDDVIFRSAGWDTRVLAGFAQWPDGIGCVHGRDGIHDGNMATLGFYSRPWVNTLGYFVPPYFASDYNDTWLSWCADQVGRRAFLPDVFTEHMHPAVGKAVIDRTHQERLTRHRESNVDALYVSPAMVARREEDVAKLRAAIEHAAARDITDRV